MWKTIAYAAVLLSLLTAALMILGEGGESLLPRIALVVFLIVAFGGYFVYWRRGPGPAAGSGDVSEETQETR